ncbi:YitT family protein [Anaerovoracaceae bacterium 42-11]
MERKLNLKGQALSFICVIAGNIVYAAAVKFFLIPGGLVTGGSTGIALAVNHLSGISVSGFVLAFNVIMLAAGFLVLGSRFALTTIVSTFTYPLALEILDRLFPETFITDDVILCTLFSGLGIGVAVGVVIRAGASTGGMDVPPLILQKFCKVPVSVSLYVFDTCILLAQAFFTGAEKILYGIVLVMIYTVVIDKLMLMGTTQTEIKIISEKSEEIKAAIAGELDRGTTLLSARGGHLSHQMEMVFTVVSNREVPKVERIVRGIDPACFMTVSRVSQVSGRGFSMGKEYKER